MKKSILVCGIYLVFLFLAAIDPALAATRKVYFSVVGKNTSNESSPEPKTIDCLISVTNSSGKEQTVIIDFTGSKVEGAGPAPTIATTLPSGVDVPAGESTTLAQTFTYPAGSSAAQTLTCTGYIQVSDKVAAEPGFVTANGTLITFFQSGVSTSTTATSGTSWSASLMYSQTPIPINAGKPF